MKKLNIDKLKDRMKKNISTKEALRDVTPMQWSNDVLTEKKKVTIRKVVK